MEKFNFLNFIAGFGLFIHGMSMLEDALQKLGSNSFKKFLQSQTKSKARGILGGALITALMQSSSTVGLIVLAFVGAGILSMAQAVPVILGANLGTTMTGWIVALLGFKFKLEKIALSLVALGAIVSIPFKPPSRYFQITRTVLGIGLLFTGLFYMKNSIAGLAQTLQIEDLAGWSSLAFFGFGILFTAIIQSSSATIAILLSALHSELIPFHLAVAMMIGSDLGTTFTLFLGTLDKSIAKKRVAMSHFLYNFFIAGLAISFLHPLIHLTTKIFGVENPLIALIFIHSFMNLVGVALFYPFIELFADFLNKILKSKEHIYSKYIKQVDPTILEAGIEALSKEIEHLLEDVLVLNNVVLRSTSTTLEEKALSPIGFATYFDGYSKTKKLGGEIFRFSFNLDSQVANQTQKSQIQMAILATKESLNSLKQIKDISHNFREFRESPNPSIEEFLEKMVEKEDSFLSSFKTRKMEFNVLEKESIENKNQFLETIQNLTEKKIIGRFQTTSFLNLIHEIHDSNKSLLKAIRAKESIFSDGLSPETNS